MPLRRIFLLGAAALVSVAALVAIGAVLSGEFGETEGKIFATLATAFVAGSAAIAGIACLERGVIRPIGAIGLVLAAGGFLLWAEEIWAGHDSSGYWKVLGLLLIWTLTALVVTTTRLMTRSPELLRTLFPATFAATVGAGLVVSTMVIRGEGDGWQLFAILLILAVLGEILTPILQRFVITPAADTGSRERVIGRIDGTVVLAVRTNKGGRLVQVGGRDVAFGDDEMIVVRSA
jgi:hypothetical protein